MCRTGGVTTRSSEPSKKKMFLESLNLEDEDMRNTSSDTGKNDFSKVHYHPQSLYELSGLWMESMDIEDFNNYGVGRDAFSGGLRGDEISERLRFFIEECDRVQRIPFVVDDAGGFSGVVGEFLENVADEYANIPVLLYSVHSPDTSIDPKSRKRTISRNLHDAVSFSRLSAFCKLVIQVGLPSLSRSRTSLFLCIKDEMPYHTSAVYASAIHSISLPFRMEQLGPSSQSSYTCGAMAVNDLVQMLAGQAWQNMVSILDLSMPAPTFTGYPVAGATIFAGEFAAIDPRGSRRR
ncbi:unnamed protein product [Fraxinus pennsylvanica]|uniref:DML1/Misato tubulin domain-containing protein n=1 Tax=Fraxinus pennsylvanica TaxID=56036 RepID=A0AAD1Z798_9LAMI|nr:unnamed protein product [Fraxinus pennsylvanica]